MRVVILQYGDFGEVYRRLQSGGPETFRDQRHTVNFIASLASDHEVTTVAICDRAHDEVLAPGLRSIGVPYEIVRDSRRLWPLLDRLDPEAYICRTPNRTALAWAARTRVPTLPAFADNFTNAGLWSRLTNWRLGRVLRRCVMPCVANHSLSASQSLGRLGLSPSQIVPWEHRRLKPVGKAKDAPRPDRPFRLFFAGSLCDAKGVGDCIEAVAIARSKKVEIELSLAGPGDAATWTARARQHGVESSVRLLGVLASDRVLAEMRNNDAVVVPSRPDYAEGLPNTVFEAFASRSPLIASDHPAFVNRLRPALDSLRFHAGDARGLAEQVARLRHGPELYARLSRQSASALSGLYVGIEWTDLVARFIEDPRCTRDWTKGHTLADIIDLPRPAPTMASTRTTRFSRYARVLQNLLLLGPLRPAAT
jgi:glycosyltransferase involved in cell wall biosynthesis